MKSQNVSYGNDAVVDAWGRAWDETAAMGASVMQPGHLLLGLLGNGANAAWGVLRQLSFDIEGLASETRARLDTGVEPITLLPGEGEFSQIVSEVFELAHCERDVLGAPETSTSLLLLGLATVHTGELDIDTESIRKAIVHQGLAEPYHPDMIWERLTGAARLAIEDSCAEAYRRWNVRVSDPHLLFALLNNPESRARWVLHQAGIRAEALLKVLTPESFVTRNPEDREKRFTAGFRAVLYRAYDESDDMGHECIGTDHLLLGLVNYRSLPSGTMLAWELASLERMREIVRNGRAADPNHRSGEVCDFFPMDPPTRTQAPHYWEYLNPSARRAVQQAYQEAKRRGSGYVLVEHLLVELLRAPENDAVELLSRLGVDVTWIVRRALGGDSQGSTKEMLGVSPRLTKALNIAYDVGLHEDRAIWIGTAHLLLGLAEERDGLAGRILVRAGATPERIRERMTSGRLQSG